MKLEWYFNEISRRHGTFEDERDFREGLFEYGCLACEHVGIDPVRNSKAVQYNMSLQMKHLLKDVTEIYEKNHLPKPIESPDLDIIRAYFKNAR